MTSKSVEEFILDSYLRAAMNEYWHWECDRREVESSWSWGWQSLREAADSWAVQTGLGSAAGSSWHVPGPCSVAAQRSMRFGTSEPEYLIPSSHLHSRHKVKSM